ncbi:hypothetical protein [Legionella waltersii]|nr:hypothetical protein [Legionella waltersii]
MNRSMKLIMSSLILCASSSHAQIIVTLANNNSCENITGDWSGQGSAYNWLLGTCKYHGKGTISALDGQGNFTLLINADKDSGTVICPEHHTETLKGTCNNSVVTIKTDYGNITGNFTNESGNAKGTLTVSPGMDADILVQFKKN